ncbi:MAG: AMP-binding protein [Acidimicrobiales bacterium]
MGTAAPPLEPVAFSQVWTDAVAARPDGLFLCFERSDGRVAEWTYGTFDGEVARVAATLHRLGVGPGDTVHLALTNSPSFIATWLACTRLGAAMVPSDPQGRAPELAAHIARTRPVVGVCAVSGAEEYGRGVAESGHDVAVVAVDPDDVDLVAFDGSEFADWPEVAPTDRAAVMFTSGTTGRPKGVEVTQANYAFTGAVMARRSGLRSHHRQIVVLPLFHANAQYYSFAPAITVGASVALMSGFSASGFVTQCARHGATHASLFAAPLRMILARGSAPVDGVVLENCWYAQNVTTDQYEAIADLFGCAPRQLYGMTETVPAVLTEPAADPVPESMGMVTPGCELEVHDAEGRPVPDGEVGEIVVGGHPGTTLFAGYLDDPETTAASYRDGWFRTGDRAVRRPDGRHVFDGRRSDVLKVAGENVSIVEVESVIAAHPGVLEAAVVGRPDEVRDEVPVAFVVARDPENPPTSDELARWAEARLAKSKRPRSFTLLEELPRTSVGKIRKFLLADPEAESTPTPETSR